MVLLTWRLMPDEMHPRWNREAWESQFYFTSRTLSGSKSLFAFDTASRHPLQLALASPSPNLFHQPHFVWEQESLRSEHRKPPSLANWPLHRHRQIYFTSRTLSGSKSLFVLNTASRQLSPTGPCIAIAKFISPAALCLGAEFSASRTA